MFGFLNMHVVSLKKNYGGELDPPRVIAARWDLGLIPWATQRKAPLPYPLSPGARPTFS